MQAGGKFHYRAFIGLVISAVALVACSGGGPAGDAGTPGDAGTTSMPDSGSASGAGTAMDCQRYFAIGQSYAELCQSPVPATSILTLCEQQAGQCNSNDIALMDQAATCVGLLTTCDYSQVMACVSKRSSLSTNCQVTVNVVMNAYNSQTGG